MKDGKRVVYRAGVIPFIFEGNTLKMLFMKPSSPEYGGDRFQIAKGKVEPGEQPETAALREGMEELGLFRGNIEYTNELGVFMGRTTVFVSKVKDEDMFGLPHFETEETRWMTLDEFLAEGRELHRPVVKAASRFIMKKEHRNE